MSCCSRRVKASEIRPEQKWDFISLQDFKSTSCFAPLAYGYLWVSLLISVAVYAVDTFTAVNLLAFNKFTSIQPYIPLNISKWIFSGCIILSWLNLGYEHFRAWRVIKRGAVAESYLDSLAVRLQCIRMGEKGRGWRRFLVFAELTKSKKGAEYVALFTYFSFQSWIRVIFCSGPRQVVNALTLYSVYETNLDPKSTDAATSILQFFKNIGILADENYRQAVILSGMLFTLIIWIFAALSLITALLFYLLFLWHYIPNGDGGLSGYCEKKINGRLTRIVSAKVNKALEEEERKRARAERKAAKNGEKPVTGRTATLPTLFDEGKADDKLPNMPMLGRNDTMTTLPQYSSRPGTPSSQQPSVPDFELSNLDRGRPIPARTGTASSMASFSSNAPLMAGASEMGYGRSASPAPSLPPMDANGFPFPTRTASNVSNSNDGFPFPQRSTTGLTGMSPDSNGPPYPQRTMTGSSAGSQWQRNTPQPMRNGPMGPPSRQMTQDSFSNGSRGPLSRQGTQDGFQSGLSREMTADDDNNSTSGGYFDASNGRNSPRPQRTPGDNYGRNNSDPAIGPAGRRTPFAEMGSGTPNGGRLPLAELSSGSPNGGRLPFAELSSGAPNGGRPSIAEMGSGQSNGGRPPIAEMSSGQIDRRPLPFAEMGAGGRSSPAPGSQMGRSSPAPGSQMGRSSPAPMLRNLTGPSSPTGSGTGSFTSYNGPPRSASGGPQRPRADSQARQQRNVTEPIPRRPVEDYYGNSQPPRLGTPQSMSSVYSEQAPQSQYTSYQGPGSDVGSQRGPPRGGSPASFGGRPGPPQQQQQGGYRR